MSCISDSDEIRQRAKPVATTPTVGASTVNTTNHYCDTNFIGVLCAFMHVHIIYIMSKILFVCNAIYIGACIY